MLYHNALAYISININFLLPDKPRRFFVAELLFVHIPLHFLKEQRKYYLKLYIFFYNTKLWLQCSLKLPEDLPVSSSLSYSDESTHGLSVREQGTYLEAGRCSNILVTPHPALNIVPTDYSIRRRYSGASELSSGPTMFLWHIEESFTYAFVGLLGILI